MASKASLIFFWQENYYHGPNSVVFLLVFGTKIVTPLLLGTNMLRLSLARKLLLVFCFAETFLLIFKDCVKLYLWRFLGWSQSNKKLKNVHLQLGKTQ